MLAFGPNIQILDGNNQVIEQEKNVIDVFLTEEQAIGLFKELAERINNAEADKIKSLLKL